jgi:hypothetical protein
MRAIAAGFAVVMLLAQAPSSSVAQVTSPRQSIQAPAPPEVMSERLEATAADILRVGATAARLAQYDLAWPATPDEYGDVGKTALLLVSAVSGDLNELPIRRVYLRIDGVDVPLQRISSLRSEVGSARIRAAVGAYREDAFFLVPARAIRRPGNLLVDFAANRSEFNLAALPLDTPSFVAKDPDTGPSQPKGGAIATFFKREFPGWTVPLALP